MKFLNAFCTNTRLMGTIMLAIEWERDKEIVSHVFMLDSEGLGISDFFEIIPINENERAAFYIQRYGGLGGINISLNMDEACMLINRYYEKNIRNEKEIPESFTSTLVNFYKLHDTGDIDVYDLMKKTCKPVESELEFVNYMVMRFIARDRESLLYFSDNEAVSTYHITKINGALLYNEIEKKSKDRFVCNCVFEDIDGYYEAKIVVNIEIIENDGDEIYGNENSYRLRSILVVDVNPIYDFEVFDIISKKEAIDIYSIKKDREKFERYIMDIYPGVQKQEFETGTMFIQYFFDNSHVDSDIYVINNDIMFIIYIDNERFYLSTYEYETREFVEEFIEEVFGSLLEKEDVLEFEQNVLFDFAESGNEDFYDFID